MPSLNSAEPQLAVTLLVFESRSNLYSPKLFHTVMNRMLVPEIHSHHYSGILSVPNSQDPEITFSQDNVLRLAAKILWPDSRQRQRLRQLVLFLPTYKIGKEGE